MLYDPLLWLSRIIFTIGGKIAIAHKLPYRQIINRKLPMMSAANSTASSTSVNTPESVQYQLLNMAIRPISPDVKAVPQKPMRPLTSYHIFFQLERELIIQTMAGDDADESILANKVYLNDVPQRYRNIKLLPNWFAGPGKRQKRKHRKQHGQIGFLELSHRISSTWANLEDIDPEVKLYVQTVAQDQIEEYYREMEEYKMLTNYMPESIQSEAPTTVPKKKTKKRSNNTNTSTVPVQKSPDQLITMSPMPNLVSSSSLYMTPQMYDMAMELEQNIENFLSRMESRALSLLPFTSQEVLSPLLRSENQVQKKRKTFHRKDSALSVSKFDDICVVSNPDELPTRVSPMEEVDLLDDEILKLWTDHN